MAKSRRTKLLLSIFSLLLSCNVARSDAVEMGIRPVNHCIKNYVLENGYANFDDTEKLTGASVTITCLPGYEIKGTGTTTCLDTGDWSKDTTCKIKDCGAAYHLFNGHVNFEGKQTTYNEIVPVSCVEGYEIHGPAFLTCAANGSWRTGTSCVKKNCGAKYTLENGRVNFIGRDTTYSNKIPVTCNDGYKLVGDDHIVCQSDGEWSKPTQCVMRDCGTEFSIAHGHVDFSGKETTYTAKVPVTCDKGYAIQGPSSITCLPDGTWSKSTKCHIKDCGRKYQLTNGYASFPGFNTTYGSIVPILCNDGYELIGDDFITCQPDGTWSKGSSCRIKDCGGTYIISNGHVNLKGVATTFHQRIPVTCNTGFDLIGDHEITCLHNGKWSNDTKCVPKDCGSKYSIPNAYLDFSGMTTYGHTVPVKCNEGYNIQGGSFIKCLSDGTWSKKTQCRIKTCPKSYHLENGQVNFPKGTVTYQGIVPVTCDVGYEIDGVSFITCLADGSWSTASCQVKDCGKKYSIDHGKVDFTSVATTYSQKAPITCVPGYNLQGEKFTMCQSDGTWSKHTRCVIKDCGTVYPLDFGYAEFAGRHTTFNHTVPVKCDVGYGLQGDPSIRCLSNGVWSRNTICAIKSCRNNLIIENGVVHFLEKKETLFHHKVFIACDTGYELHGDNYTICQHDGTWIQNTVCRIKDCGKNYTFDNGHVTFQDGDTAFNETAPFTCSEGYEVQGDNFITCQADGTWSQATCIKSENLLIPIAVGAGVGVIIIAIVVTTLILKWKRKLCFAGRWSRGLF